MTAKKPNYEEMPEAVRDSLEGRLFRYKENLDIYRVERLDILMDDEEGISLIAYDLNVHKRCKIFYEELKHIEFVDTDSEGLAKAIEESFTSSL